MPKKTNPLKVLQPDDMIEVVYKRRTHIAMVSVLLDALEAYHKQPLTSAERDVLDSYIEKEYKDAGLDGS